MVDLPDVLCVVAGVKVVDLPDVLYVVADIRLVALGSTVVALFVTGRDQDHPTTGHRGESELPQWDITESTPGVYVRTFSL